MRSPKRYKLGTGQELTLVLSKYNNLLQGKATNALSRTSKKSMNYDRREDSGWAKQDGVVVTLQNCSLLNLNVQTHKVFHALLLKLTKNFSMKKKATAETINKGREVVLSLKEYMDLCGLKDRKESRKQLKEAVQAIYNISLEWTDIRCNGKKKEEITWKARIAELLGQEWSDDPVKNSKVIFRFTFDIAERLSQSYIMPFPQNLFHINSKQNPHSYYIGQKLLVHYNQNFDRDNRNRIQVSTLLRGLPDIPTYDDTEHITQLIIEPFERDLDALVDRYSVLDSWEYCNKKGAPLTEKQLENMSYDVWTNLLIQFEPKDYPRDINKIEKIKNHLIAADK